MKRKITIFAIGMLVLSSIIVYTISIWNHKNSGTDIIMKKPVVTSTQTVLSTTIPKVSLNPTTLMTPVLTPTSVLSQESDPIKIKIREMTLEEKIGQMVISGLDGIDLDNHARELIEKYHVGGFILFQKNIRDISQTQTLINTLKEINKINRFPLWMSVDEEGGRISRMPSDFVKIPTNQVIGQVNSNIFSYQIGKAQGEKIKLLGFNMDFAPVLDINSNPNNPIIGDRSFGTAPEIVGQLGVQTMLGIRSQDIVSVVKHFPGHGDTSVDSHLGLPIVYHDLNRLNSFELVPFAKAIKNHADVVMVAHILLPQIDGSYPASLSKIMITDILRENLGFQGVVITDDITMGAIAKNYNLGEAAVMSVNAGTDIILVCHEFENEIAVINSMNQAVIQGTLSIDRIDTSVYRILSLKNQHKLTDQATNPFDISKINQTITDLLNVYINH